MTILLKPDNTKLARARPEASHQSGDKVVYEARRLEREEAPAPRREKRCAPIRSS